MENMICSRNKDINLLTPYINKPVYIKGYCWSKSFDGWVVIYDDGRKPWHGERNLLFDYRGETYTVYGFLPGIYATDLSSTYNNAFYKKEC